MTDKPESATAGWHPEEQDLVLLLDGELAGKTVAEVRVHLESCWSCRVRLERLEQAISRFVTVRNLLLMEHPVLPPDRWNRFSGMLRSVARASGRRSPATVLSAWWRRVNKGWTLAMVAGAAPVVALLVVLLVHPIAPSRLATPVEILDRAVVAEERDVRAVAQPVIYQKLRVSKTVASRGHGIAARGQAPTSDGGSSSFSASPGSLRSFTWETWNDAANARLRQRVGVGQGAHFVSTALSEPASRTPAEDDSGEPALRELQQALDANHLRWQRPLSAESYRSWRARLSSPVDQVTNLRLADGTEALALTTRNRPSATAGADGNSVTAGPTLVEAKLIVRAHDWHPVEQDLRFQDSDLEQDYQIAEDAYEVVSLDVLTPGIFPEPIEATANAPEPVTAMMDPLPSAAEMEEVELEARYALHVAAADLGEPVEVIRTREQIEVRGLFNTAARKLQVAAVLGTVPHLQADLHTVEEAAREANVPTQPADASRTATNVHQPANAEQVVRVGLPLEDQLEQYFHGNPTATAVTPSRQVQDLANHALQFSQTTLLEAWALRHLAERYSAESASGLLPHQRRLLEAMIHDHLENMRRQIQTARESIAAPLRAVAVTTAEPVPEGVFQGAKAQDTLLWPQSARLVFERISQLDQSVQSVFGGSGLPASPDPVTAIMRTEAPQQSAAELVGQLETLARDIAGLEQQSRGDFLGKH